MTKPAAEGKKKAKAEKPLPCPFCGKRPKSSTWKWIDDGPCDSPWERIGCNGRDHTAYSLRPTEAEAIRAWNKRKAGKGK